MYRNIIITTLVLVLSISSIYGQNRRQKKKADEATLSWRYEVVCEKGGGVGNTYLVRVTSYVREPSISIEQSKKNAVHSIIFTGVTGNSEGCVTKRPMTNNPSIYNENIDFFKSFFVNNGTYGKYTTLPTGRPERVIKINKKEFKVETVVSVNVDLLRKNLEDANILKSLNSGF
jgi:hypothetical protein